MNTALRVHTPAPVARLRDGQVAECRIAVLRGDMYCYRIELR
jgi:hypothetical protein